MNNDAKERLRSVARRLAETAFMLASDDATDDQEFQSSIDALVLHLTNVRKRTQDMHTEELLA